MGYKEMTIKAQHAKIPPVLILVEAFFFISQAYQYLQNTLFAENVLSTDR